MPKEENIFGLKAKEESANIAKIISWGKGEKEIFVLRNVN